MSNEDTIPASPLAPLMAQLFYHAKPKLDFLALRDAVKRYCGEFDPVSTTGAGASLAHFFMDEGVVEFKEGRAKSQLCLTKAKALPKQAFLEVGFRQTWNWNESRITVADCTRILSAIDLKAGTLDRFIRSQLFLGFVRSVLEVVPAEAIYFLNSQLFVDPKTYLDQQERSLGEKMQSLVNVRLFRIESKQGECLMDTLGLLTFGLPDIQCHFHSLDCGAVANKLYDVGMYLFEKGDVIKDGETVPGLSDKEKWLCQHENALVGPERIVLDLNPGPAYAAGGRK